MPRRSETDNVRKRCTCTTWKTCAHPWYLDARITVIDPTTGTKTHERYRPNLDNLIDRHAADFAEAKIEAQRAIDAKRNGRDAKGLQPGDDVTLAALLAQFDQEKPRADRWQIGKLIATTLRSPAGPRPFGEWRLSLITTDTLKEFRRLRPKIAGNRDLALLRAAFNMAVANGLVARSPFRVGDVSVVKLTTEAGRTRRLHPGEAEQLLMHAGSIRNLVIAALETGCRKGELLSLQWHQVRFHPRAEIFLPAQKTKAKKDRRVPISTVLAPILEARRRDPAGAVLPPDAYVFGDELGRRRTSIKRPWAAAVLRAHGETPRYVKRPATGTRRARLTANLTPASRAILATIDLHFHDLRREAGSRWMDAGVPLGTIQRWLGHHNIAQTSTYLGASIGGDEQDMRAFEERVGRVAAVAAPPDSMSEGRDPRAARLVTTCDQKSASRGPLGDRTVVRAIEIPSKSTRIH